MVNWGRPLLPLEADLAEGSEKFNCFNLTFWIDITSEEPIKEELFKEALLFLSRTCENLRVQIKRKDGQLTFAEVDEPEIAMEVLRGMKISEVKDRLQHQWIDYTSGPLWKAVLLDHETPDNRYTIFFHFSHALTDGLTCVKIFKKFFGYLENCLHGEKPDDSQIGHLGYAHEFQNIVKKRKDELLKNPSLKDELWKEFKKLITPDPLMKKIYKSGEEASYVEMIQDSMSECDTDLLVAKCRQNGVTVHSALTAALNFAYFDVLQKKKIVTLDSCKITGSHIVSFRRHMQDKSEALGCILGVLDHCDEFSLQNLSSFWDYTKRLHADLHPKLTGEDMLNQEALRSLNNLGFDVTTKETPYNSYFISNYTRLDFGNDRKIKTQSLSRECLMGRGSACFMFVFYTFKGKLISLVDYIPAYIDPDIVKNIHSEMISILKECI